MKQDEVISLALIMGAVYLLSKESNVGPGVIGDGGAGTGGAGGAPDQNVVQSYIDENRNNNTITLSPTRIAQVEAAAESSSRTYGSGSSSKKVYAQSISPVILKKKGLRVQGGGYSDVIAKQSVTKEEASRRAQLTPFERSALR